MSTIERLDLGDKKEHASRQKCRKSSSTETNYESFSAVNIAKFHLLSGFMHQRRNTKFSLSRKIAIMRVATGGW